MISIGRSKAKLRSKLLGWSTGKTFSGVLLSLPNGALNARAKSIVGQRLMEDGKLLEAREFLERAVGEDQNNAELIYRLGVLHQRIGAINSASDCFDRAIDLHDAPKYRYHHSVAQELLGDVHQAIADLFAASGAEQQDERVVPRLWKLITSSELSDVDQERYLIRGIELGVGGHAWHKRLGQITFARRDLKNACIHFERAIKSAELPVDDQYKYAIALNETGLTSQASSIFLKITDQLPKDERQFGVGALHARKGNWTLAKRYFTRETPKLGILPEYYFRTGMAYDRTYDWNGAEHYFSLALAEDGSRPYWHWRLAFVLERQEKYAAAAEHYYSSAALGGNHGGYYYAGRMYLKAGDESNAIDSFTRAHSLDEDGRVYLYSDRADNHDNRFESRLPSLAQAKTPQSAYRFRTAGIELVREGRYSVAIPYLMAAASSLPEHDSMLFYAMGIALSREGKLSKALESFLQMRPVQRPDGIGNAVKLSSEEALTSRYIAYREELPIDTSALLYEVGHGSSISCNPFALYKTARASAEYADLMHYWVVDESVEIPEVLLNDENVVLVKRGSNAYFRALATAKYLINNTSFGSYFIRREGQVYLNTWHGTPWKTLGKSVRNEFLAYGNIGRNLLQVTHLAVGNKWTADALLDEHNVRYLFSGKVAVTGSPRNDALQSPQPGAGVLGLDDRIRSGEGPLVIYIPTWRGTLGDDGQIQYDVDADLRVLKTIESSGCRVLYSAHRFVYEYARDSELSRYLIPKHLDLYEVLKDADAVVTDYSSVFVDFLIVDKPIIFYFPDIDRYESERGLYNLTLPGATCRSIDELKIQVSAVVAGADDFVEERTKLASQLTSSEDGNAAVRVLRWIMGDADEQLVLDAGSDAKPVLFRHSFIPNGIASSFRALAKGLSAETEVVPHVLVDRGSLLSDVGRREQLALLGDSALVVPRSGAMLRSKEERWLERKDQSQLTTISEPQRVALLAGYRREYTRLFGSTVFALSCEFDGYSTFWTRVIGSSSIESRRAVYMHNNMLEERSKKHAELHRVMADYELFDSLISVSESVSEENCSQLAPMYGLPVDRFEWANNLVDSERVRLRAEEPVDSSYSEFIENSSKLIVAVGRLSQEKGHDRLLRALARRSDELRLMVVGGGPEMDSLRALAYSLGLNERVLFTGQVLNPYPLMLKASAVALLSRWEGQGLALLEAMLLGRPIVATDIPGPRSIVDSFGGNLVPNDDEGVSLALDLIASSNLELPSFDVELYNNLALKKFVELVL